MIGASWQPTDQRGVVANAGYEQAERFLLVRLRHGCGAAIPLRSVVEVTRLLPTESVTGAPACVEGLTIVRGKPMPVINLAAVLGLAESGDLTHLVIVTVGDRGVAVAVASVVGVADLGVDSLTQTPPLLGEAFAERMEAVRSLDRQLLFVLNTSRLLTEDAWLALDRSMAEAS